MAPKKSRGKVNNRGKEIAVHKKAEISPDEIVHINSRTVAFKFEEGCHYASFLEVVRNSVTGRVAFDRRITFSSPPGITKQGELTRLFVESTHFVDLDLTSYTNNGVTLRVFGHNVYGMAAEKHKERGTWYCLNRELANLIPGGFYVGFGENYKALGGLDSVRLGLIPIAEAIDTLNNCKEVNNMKKPLVTLFVNVLEGSRFPKLGETISSHVAEFRDVPMDPTWETTIHSWGDESSRIAKGLGIHDIDAHPPVNMDGWNTHVEVRGDEAGNVVCQDELALLLSSRVFPR